MKTLAKFHQGPYTTFAMRLYFYQYLRGRNASFCYCLFVIGHRSCFCGEWNYMFVRIKKFLVALNKNRSELLDSFLDFQYFWYLDLKSHFSAAFSLKLSSPASRRRIWLKLWYYFLLFWKLSGLKLTYFCYIASWQSSLIFWLKAKFQVLWKHRDISLLFDLKLVEDVWGHFWTFNIFDTFGAEIEFFDNICFKLYSFPCLRRRLLWQYLIIFYCFPPGWSY